MTGGRACWSAMARPALALPLALLALAAVGECMNCAVCIPPMTGDKPSQKEAAQWRANISRTFANKAESDFQVCGQNDPAKEQPEARCPWDTEDVVCLDVQHSSWLALTCGRIPFDSDLQCFNKGGAKVCPCANSYCNNQKLRSGQLGGGSGWRDAAASARLMAALLVVGLAAAW